MKKVLLLLTLLSTLTASAYDAEIDGIYYNLINKVKQAKVTSGDTKYTGSVNIPNTITYNGDIYSVTEIGGDAFANCYYLNNVSIPNSITSIGGNAFINCYGLSSITIPNSVTSIGGYAFKDCSGLTSVTIPNSVTSINDGTFIRCTSLTSINIPTSLTSIGTSAFYMCSGLTSIEIPNSVTSIGKSAFLGCSSLTSVTIPNGVTSIGNNAFSGCEGLTSVTIPNSVINIGSLAFGACTGLISITIGNEINSIGSKAFQSCYELADVYCYAENVPITASDAFNLSYSEYVTLHVPEVSVNAYKTTVPWSGFGTIKAIGDIPVTEKCATPTISYENGKLTFSCATEGATCQYSITDTDIKAGSGNEVQLTTTYKVTVYATKDGYENSDVATKDINVSGGASGLRGDVNNDGTVNMPDAMFIVNKILNGKFPDE